MVIVGTERIIVVNFCFDTVEYQLVTRPFSLGGSKTTTANSLNVLWFVGFFRFSWEWFLLVFVVCHF